MKSREDKKAFKKFIIIMVISCLAGGVFGFFLILWKGNRPM